MVAGILEASGDLEIAGFLDDLFPEKRGLPFCGSTVLGGREQLDSLKTAGVDRLVVAVGDCRVRTQLAQTAASKGFQLERAIHPKAVIAPGVSIGPGTVVAAGAVINPGVTVGPNAIINTSSSVDHECCIGEGAHIGPGVRLGGRVTVGRCAWVGIGAVVKDGITIGADSIVGAGAVVLDPIPDGVVAYGVPAKVVRKANDR